MLGEHVRRVEEVPHFNQLHMAAPYMFSDLDFTRDDVSDFSKASLARPGMPEVASGWTLMHSKGDGGSSGRSAELCLAAA